MVGKIVSPQQLVLLRYKLLNKGRKILWLSQVYPNRANLKTAIHRMKLNVALYKIPHFYNLCFAAFSKCFTASLI